MFVLVRVSLFSCALQGLFRISCEDILRILRRGRETLLTLLEAFVYDPLIDWTQSEDAAFPLALRSSKELGVRQTRKEMEWEVSEGMLVNKLAESQSMWQRNRSVSVYNYFLFSHSFSVYYVIDTVIIVLLSLQ